MPIYDRQMQNYTTNLPSSISVENWLHVEELQYNIKATVCKMIP